LELQEDSDDTTFDSVEFEVTESTESLPSVSDNPGKVRPSEPPEKSSRSTLKKGSSKKRPPIRVHHSVHDRLQVESNITFDLRPRDDEEEREFKMDFYLYLPTAVGINSSNFSSSQFFRYRTNYYRVRAPLYHQLRTIDPEDFTFDSAEDYFSNHLSSLERERLGGKVVQDVKLFGNFLHTEFKKLKGKLSRHKRKSRARKEELGDALLHRRELLEAFRNRYLSAVRAEKFLVEADVVRAFTLTDEYLSYRLELALLKAKDVLPHRAEVFQEILSDEMSYREEHKMLVLGGKGRESVAFEAYTYRLGLLKKYLGESLFLQLDSNKKDRFYRNVAAAIGAGLAATVAGLAEHQRVQYLTGNDSGLRLAFLIGVAVLAYIFKDRVKDLSKEYVNSRLKERLPDQSFAMSHNSYSNSGKKKVRDLGEVSEYFRFVSDVPADVTYLRTLGQVRTSDPERREHVMQLGRRYRYNLTSKKNKKLFPLLKNIHRLDLSPFLTKLDNPKTPISFVNSVGETETVQAPKVYHLNAVVRYEAIYGTEERTRFVDYERFRVVVNKNGIVRLENVVDMGRLAYEDKIS